ncbi:MAG: BatA domain-containing protein [Planctomycetota bacterium]
MSFTLAQLGSAFIAPALAGLGAAAIAVPIAIHLLSRLRRKRERWGAMRFLRLAYQKQKNRLRLEQWLLLATRCLLVGLIGLALAGPVLGGGWASWLSGWFGAGGGGRTVHVVVDDALNSGALEENAGNPETQETQERQTRLDALKREALAWVDASGAGDRLVLWTTTATASGASDASGPIAVSEAGMPRGELVAAIEALSPGFGAADWPALVSAVADDVSERDASGAALAGGGDVVAVLSGFARSAGGLEEPASAGVGDIGGASGVLERLGDASAVVLRRPGASRENLQVSAAGPRRAEVLLAGTSATGDAEAEVEVLVSVRRFGDTAEAADAAVRVEVQAITQGEGGPPEAPGLVRGGRAADANTLGSAERLLSLNVGQAVATAVVPVRFPAEALDAGGDAVDLGLRVSLIDPTGAAGSAEALSSLTLDALPADDVSFGVVRVLRRLRVGIQGGDTSADGTGLGPSVFVRSALSAGLDERAVEFVDLRAEDTAAWSAALSEDAEPLDAVFVLSPSRLGASGRSGGGWSALSGWVEAGGLLWVSPDAAEQQDGPGGWASAMALGLSAQTGMSASLRFADDDDSGSDAVGPRVGISAPEALSSLSGEWDALLGPVRVSAWRSALPGADSETWIALRENDEEVSVSPWLVAERLGAGTVLTLGSALDPAWTNLPAKPVFPALIQEALRHGLASRVPTRSFAWDEVRGDASSLRSERGLMAMNVEAAAGDTTALSDAALSAWWDDAVGPWGYVPGEAEGGPAAVLARGAPSLPLGRYLLWAVLALVLMESLLSRRFSHATTSRPGAGSRLVALIRGWRHGVA